MLESEIILFSLVIGKYGFVCFWCRFCVVGKEGWTELGKRGGFITVFFGEFVREGSLSVVGVFIKGRVIC